LLEGLNQSVQKDAVKTARGGEKIRQIRRFENRIKSGPVFITKTHKFLCSYVSMRSLMKKAIEDGRGNGAIAVEDRGLDEYIQIGYRDMPRTWLIFDEYGDWIRDSEDYRKKAWPVLDRLPTGFCPTSADFDYGSTAQISTARF
jgi:hypothetical protein